MVDNCVSGGAPGVPNDEGLPKLIADKLNVLKAIKLLKPLDAVLYSTRTCIVHPNGNFHKSLKIAVQLLSETQIRETKEALNTLKKLRNNIDDYVPSLIRPLGPFHQNIQYAIRQLMEC